MVQTRSQAEGGGPPKRPSRSTSDKLNAGDKKSKAKPKKATATAGSSTTNAGVTKNKPAPKKATAAAPKRVPAAAPKKATAAATTTSEPENKKARTSARQRTAAHAFSQADNPLKFHEYAPPHTGEEARRSLRNHPTKSPLFSNGLDDRGNVLPPPSPTAGPSRVSRATQQGKKKQVKWTARPEPSPTSSGLSSPPSSPSPAGVSKATQQGKKKQVKWTARPEPSPTSSSGLSSPPSNPSPPARVRRSPRSNPMSALSKPAGVTKNTEKGKKEATGKGKGKQPAKRTTTPTPKVSSSAGLSTSDSNTSPPTGRRTSPRTKPTSSTSKPQRVAKSTKKGKTEEQAKPTKEAKGKSQVQEAKTPTPTSELSTPPSNPSPPSGTRKSTRNQSESPSPPDNYSLSRNLGRYLGRYLSPGRSILNGNAPNDPSTGDRSRTPPRNRDNVVTPRSNNRNPNAQRNIEDLTTSSDDGDYEAPLESPGQQLLGELSDSAKST